MIEIKTFSQRLRDTRVKNGLTQAALAKKIGVSTQTISSYESFDSVTGGKTPSLTNAISIAKTLGVSLDWLCGIKNHSTDISVGDFAKCLERITFWPSVRTSIDGGWPQIAFERGRDRDYENVIATFLFDLIKMQELVEGNTISKDLYNNWLSDRIHVLSETSFSEYDEEALCDGLPF